MRLVVDLQGAQTASHPAGSRFCLLSFAKALARNRGEHEMIVALSDSFIGTIKPIRRALRGLLPADAVRVWTAPGPVAFSGADNTAHRMRAETIHGAFLANLEPDVILVSTLLESCGDDAVISVGDLGNAIPTAVVHHDPPPFNALDRTDPARHAFLKERTEALKRADLVLAASDHAASHARSLIGMDSHEIVPVRATCSEGITNAGRDPAERHRLVRDLGIDGPYIVMADAIDSLDSLGTVLAAMARLPEPVRVTHRLVLVTAADPSQRQIVLEMARTSGLSPDDLVVLGRLPDEARAALHAEAQLMVLPATEGGFAVPPLEARACGTPALGARAANLPKVNVGDDALFDPHDADALAQLIARALEEGPFRNSLLRQAAERAAAFSLDRMATRTWAACEDLAARRAPTARSRSEILHACAEAIARTRPDERELDALAQALAFDFPEPNQERRVLVDVSRLYREDVRTGIQRVARSILLEWLENPPDGVIVEPVFASDDRPGYFYAWSYVARLAGGPARGADAPIDYTAGDVFFGLDLSPYIGAQKAFLQRMHARGVRIVFVVHDLLPVDMPENFSPALVDNFREWLGEIAQYDGIIAVSDATARRFRKWRLANCQGAHATDDFLYAHVHCGADIENSAPTTGLPADADNVLSRLAARPSFLMVGTVEPRKGHAQALDAMELLWDQQHDINLVIVGKQGWLVERLAERLRNHPEAGERLYWLAGISDEYLAKVYDVATCALVNSVGEGFGLPLIEAARHKVPLLVRDIPVFREVAGEHARYFTAPTAGALAEVIEAWLEDHRRGNVPSSESMPWLTWKQSARKMADILLRADRTQTP